MTTIAEKILARASGKGEVEAGEIVMADIDIAMIHDLTGPLAVESFNKIGTEKVWDSSKIVVPLTIKSQQIHWILQTIIFL